MDIIIGDQTIFLSRNKKNVKYVPDRHIPNVCTKKSIQNKFINFVLLAATCMV